MGGESDMMVVAEEEILRESSSFKRPFSGPAHCDYVATPL